jgi:hypothetical protein
MPPKQWPTSSASRGTAASAAPAGFGASGRKDANIYAAGVKDPTGKTTEYFVSWRSSSHKFYPPLDNEMVFRLVTWNSPWKMNVLFARAIAI